MDFDIRHCDCFYRFEYEFDRHNHRSHAYIATHGPYKWNGLQFGNL